LKGLAAFDLTRAHLPWIGNEIAAHIAQAFYARNAGLGDAAFAATSPTFVAWLVVDKMVQEHTTFAGSVTDSNSGPLGDLRTMLYASPQYGSYIQQDFRGDG